MRKTSQQRNREYWSGVHKSARLDKQKLVKREPVLSSSDRSELDAQQRKINEAVDNRHAIQIDPGRRVLGKEFLMLKRFY